MKNLTSLLLSVILPENPVHFSQEDGFYTGGLKIPLWYGVQRKKSWPHSEDHVMKLTFGLRNILLHNRRSCRIHWINPSGQ